MRRLVSVFVLSLLLAPGVALAQGPTEEPIGSLAQLMRGIMFPNANKLFDVQAVEPGGEPVRMNEQLDELLGDVLAENLINRINNTAADAMSSLMGSASTRFAAIYRGWPEVEGAAVALADGAKLAMMEGRLCDNGVSAPVDQADYVEGARLLEESAVRVLDGARTRDYDAVWDAINYVNDSCTHCHKTYRDGPDSRQEPRCQ